MPSVVDTDACPIHRLTSCGLNLAANVSDA